MITIMGASGKTGALRRMRCSSKAKKSCYRTDPKTT
jgi:hypothetical protein